MSEPNEPDSMEGIRNTINKMELPTVPRKYQRTDIFFVFFHLFFCVFCLAYPYSDGQPNWLGFALNFLLLALRVFMMYVRWRSITGLERVVKHAEVLRKVVNTPIYHHDEENQTIYINFVHCLSPDQMDEMKRKMRHARRN